MSGDFDALFDALRDDCNTPLLPGPGSLRAIAQQRTRNHRIVGAAAAMVLTASLATGLAWWTGNTPIAPPAAQRTPTPSAPAPSPSAVPPPSSPTPTTTPSTPPPLVPGAVCRPSQLDPRPVYEFDGGAGNSYTTVVVRNHSNTPCRLSGYPALWYPNQAGTATALPVVDDTSASQTPVLLRPGQYAQFGLATVNGNPGGVTCNPATYTHLTVALNGGRFPLPGLTIQVTCGDIRLRPWSTSIYPTPGAPIVTRAP